MAPEFCGLRSWVQGPRYIWLTLYLALNLGGLSGGVGAPSINGIKGEGPWRGSGRNKLVFGIWIVLGRYYGLFRPHLHRGNVEFSLVRILEILIFGRARGQMK